MTIAPLKIGSLQLKTNLLLAPIAGYCDLAFRLVARRCGGVGLACTDLLSPEGIKRETRHTLELAQTNEEDSPLCMQLYGSKVDVLIDAAKWAVDHGADCVDLNMGCPVDKITKQDGGSALLCNPDQTLVMIEKLARTITSVPFTCKMRLGWDDSQIVAPYLARRLEELGVAAITIHGRTTQMMFSGNARLDGIAEVVASVKRIPVIGNGDIRTPADARRMLEHTKCAGLMIGRGALGVPWIFRDIWADLTTGIIPPAPTLEEKCEMMRQHFYGMIEYRSLRAAISEFRKRISWYGKTMNPCSEMKKQMREVASPEQFEQILADFLAWRKGRLSHLQEGKTFTSTADDSLNSPV